MHKCVVIGGTGGWEPITQLSWDPTSCNALAPDCHFLLTFQPAIFTAKAYSTWCQSAHTSTHGSSLQHYPYTVHYRTMSSTLLLFSDICISMCTNVFPLLLGKFGSGEQKILRNFTVKGLAASQQLQQRQQAYFRNVQKLCVVCYWNSSLGSLLVPLTH